VFGTWLGFRTDGKRASLAGMAVSTIVCAGLTAALLPVEEAAAAPRKRQVTVYPPYGSTFFGTTPSPRPRAARKSATPGTATAASKKAPAASGIPPGPHVIVVSIKNQNITIYGANGQSEVAPVSTGTRSNPTPTGIFSIIQKNRIHFSNLYGAAPMPNMQRITWSGVAMHAGVLPGYPASHGCIRMPYTFSSRLFAATKMGARVIVTRGDVNVTPFSSDKLFTALPEGSPAVASTPAQSEGVTLVGVTPAEAAPAPAERTRASALAAKQADIGRLTEAVKTAEAAQKEAVERNKPTLDAAAEAFKVVRKAKADSERLEKAAKLAERAKASAEERYAKLNKKAETSAATPTTTTAAPASDATSSTDVTPDPKLVELTEKAKTAREEAHAQARALAEAEARLIEANAARLKAAADARVAAQAATDAKNELASAQRYVKRFSEPVSVFVSRATGKLYVRHAWDQTIEVPVSIANPSAPIGNHVFTATEFVPGKTDLKWTVATYTVPPADAAHEKSVQKTKSKKGPAPIPTKPSSPPPAASTPAEALARIDIPQDVRDRVAELMKPGSSLIISDAPISNETGKYTDFIVQPRS